MLLRIPVSQSTSSAAEVQIRGESEADVPTTRDPRRVYNSSGSEKLLPPSDAQLIGELLQGGVLTSQHAHLRRSKGLRIELAPCTAGRVSFLQFRLSRDQGINRYLPVFGFLAKKKPANASVLTSDRFALAPALPRQDHGDGAQKDCGHQVKDPLRNEHASGNRRPLVDGQPIEYHTET
jgi:hypothetical protein